MIKYSCYSLIYSQYTLTLSVKCQWNWKSLYAKIADSPILNYVHACCHGLVFNTMYWPCKQQMGPRTWTCVCQISLAVFVRSFCVLSFEITVKYKYRIYCNVKNVTMFKNTIIKIATCRYKRKLRPASDRAHKNATDKHPDSIKRQ